MSSTMGCISCMITTTKWLPVFVTITIFSWGWFAYTFQLILVGMQSMLVQQILCLILFNILFLSAFWSYIQTIFTPFGRIPAKFYLTPEVSEDLAKAPSERHKDEVLAYFVKRNDLPVSCRTYSGAVRYCEKCNLIKPDRCHHCSICGVCILKMDHHCPWINNCVSFNNYKFFVLFLGYTFAMCIFVAATTLPYFLKYWIPQDNQFKPIVVGSNMTELQTEINNSNSNSIYFDNPNYVPFGFRFHILFLFFVSVMLSMGLVFLYCYHIYLLLNNRSTLEAFRPPLMTYGQDRNAFNLGKKENLYKVFGRSKILWLVPIFTTEGSGITYEQRRQFGQGDEELQQGLLNHHLLHNNNNNNNNNNENDNINNRPSELTNDDTGV